MLVDELDAGAVADRLLGVIGHQALELGLSVFMLEMRRPGPGKNAGEF